MMKRLLTGLKYLLYACTAGLTAYILYYAAAYSYLIYAINQHDDRAAAQRIKDYDEYIKLSYVERYTPPKQKHKNIPEPSFWIPNNKEAGYFVHVTVPDKNLIRIEMYSDVVGGVDRPYINNAVLILKAEFEGDDIPFSRFTQPNLPEDEVAYQLRYKHFVPEEIQQALPDYKEYWYLEYPQGYLVTNKGQD